MQILSRGLEDGSMKKALIITPKPRIEVLRPLRSAVAAASSDLEGALECVELAQVFDVDGVWEVLADLDRDSEPSCEPELEPEPESESELDAKPCLEIGDSQASDDEALSPVKGDSPPQETHKSLQKPGDNSRRKPPGLIIITHFSTLLTSLFTYRSSTTAHPLLQQLSSHIRYLSRNLSSSPLFLLLNTTASPGESNTSGSTSSRPLDPTLRSVFNPPVIPGLPSAGARRNKPSFGMVFSQMLDVHLLCTRLPRIGRDADEVLASGGHGGGEHVTIVEVLLDELGVWVASENEQRGVERRRNSREQRWGAVDVKKGKVVDAFEEKGLGNTSDIRLAAGFGGRRV